MVIMTDSHSGISKEEAEQKNIKVLAMPFCMDGITYYEDVDIARDAVYEKLGVGADVSTSQPSPQELTDMWDELLKEYEQILYIPISSGLSGAYMTAKALASEKPYGGKVFVVDSGRVSTTLHRMILDGLELMEAGYDAEVIQRTLDANRGNMIMYVSLSTLEYLKKGGRVKPSVATVASILNIKPIMKFDVGTLDVYKKCRGFQKAKIGMIEAMKEELSTNFKEAYEAGELYLLAASSSNKEVTEQWVQQIQEAFPDLEVLCDDLALAITCHIGPDSLGIGCSCKPKVIGE